MNRSHTTDAIILRTNRVGEIHRGVVMLSRDEGLVRAIAHGANTAKGKLRGSTVPFCSGRAYLYTNPRTDSTKITDMEASTFYAGIRGDLKKFYSASLWAELVLKTFASGGASSELYTLMSEGLSELDTRPAAAADLVSVQFLWRFLELAGSQPELDLCACCGEEMGPGESVWYLPDETGFCGDGHGCVDARGHAGETSWSPGARAYLRHSGSLALPQALRTAPPADAVPAIKHVLYTIIQDLVEAPLNTLRTGAGII